MLDEIDGDVGVEGSDCITGAIEGLDEVVENDALLGFGGRVGRAVFRGVRCSGEELREETDGGRGSEEERDAGECQRQKSGEKHCWQVKVMDAERIVGVLKW